MTPASTIAAIAVLAAACREPPAREVRMVLNASVEVRAVGLKPPMPGIEAAYMALNDGARRLDLGNNAKGYAVDQAMAALRAKGARKALVNFGGGVLAVTGEPIILPVPDPQSPGAPRWATFSLDEAAMGTTTYGARGKAVLAATVVARSALEADTLDTEILGMSPEEGLALLVQRGAAGFVLLSEDGRKVLRATPGFVRAHSLEATPGVTVRE